MRGGCGVRGGCGGGEVGLLNVLIVFVVNWILKTPAECAQGLVTVSICCGNSANDSM